ncbi:SDR family NAD(P)-dependent oxidoreductase [Metabacillus sp. HB246100]
MIKTALITGATSGIGYEFVKLFSRGGYNLVVVGRNEEKLDEIEQVFHHVEITRIQKDLSKPGAAKEIFEELSKLGITIDVVVNNAGFGLLGEFDTVSLEEQSRMIQLNITALTELTHYFLPYMKKMNDGKIVNIASTAAFQPGPLMAVYYATKAYVLSFSEALAEELKGKNITVTTICPGATKTNFGAAANVEHTIMFSNAMDAKEVAKQSYEGIMKGRRVVIPGAKNKAGAYAAKFLPRSLTAKIAKAVAGEKE